MDSIALSVSIRKMGSADGRCGCQPSARVRSRCSGLMKPDTQLCSSINGNGGETPVLISVCGAFIKHAQTHNWH